MYLRNEREADDLAYGKTVVRAQTDIETLSDLIGCFTQFAKT
ncbi:hypothetical protein VCR4J2_570002 [Vibrio coralliirubri]|nr:hypothetical protein VCR4J2_570002 [Vibrio coralliirubri]